MTSRLSIQAECVRVVSSRVASIRITLAPLASPVVTVNCELATIKYAPHGDRANALHSCVPLCFLPSAAGI